MKEEAKKENAPQDSIEIPVGKVMRKLKDNAIVLGLAAVVLVLALVWFKGGVTGNVVAGDDAGEALVDFINSQGNGVATFVSAKESSGMYEVIVNYNGEEIPVYVTLDGQYLITDRVPLTGGAISGEDANNEPIEVVEGDNPVKGKADASVTIVEFTDYQCPFCAKYYSETYKQIIRDYVETGKVRYVLMDFPLNFHPESEKSAESAECVRDQNGDEGYFKMHDKLFEGQSSLSVANYKKWAREVGANGAIFDSCLDSGKFASEIEADLAYGSSIGVSGTPAFFINGINVEGAQPYSVFKQVIDAELAK